MKVYIVSNESKVFSNYRLWLRSCVETEYPNEADLFLFAGGEDVHPFLYGELCNKKTVSSAVRDAREVFCFNYARKNQIPMLGVCRGSQFLTVMAGGSLFQHVEGHIGDHTTFLSNGQVITVVSTHHQMMNPYSLEPNEYKILGVSNKIITEFINGYGEKVELPEFFPEPEFVYYPKINALAIQGHPERQIGQDDLDEQIIMFEDFYNGNMHNWEDLKYSDRYEY